MKNTIMINNTFNLIQMVRLVHAICESDFNVVIPLSEIDKFSILKSKFGVSFSSSDIGAFDITDRLKLDHSNPQTSVGNLSRCLIFPSAIAKYCHSIWANPRKFRYSFQGLVTDRRKALIEDWLRRNMSCQYKLPSSDKGVYKLRRKILSKLGLDYTVKIQLEDLLLWSSDRGRQFPTKAWDEEYFRVISNSQFVLCPSGDYPWSYRFFESILCGAIPIVEKDCAAYEGFRFFSLEDNAKDLKWSLEDAEYNYSLCTKKLTIPKEDLNETIAKIIQEID